MNIVWLSSEVYPFAKTGGLADVSSALPEALAKNGHQVSVIMPWYPQTTGKLNLTFSERIELLGVPFGERTEWASIHKLETKTKGLTYYFIEFNRYFDRPRLYDWNGMEYQDNAERFIFFSRACMQTVLRLELKPDIIHANDWHCALACVYLKSDLYRGFDAFANTRSILTIHNLGYQGIFRKENMYWTGLGWDYFNSSCLEYYDSINLLKSGIMTADRVNTVSPTYAQEILTSEYGAGLEPSLRHRDYYSCLRGILNGIDTDIWNPQTDRYLKEISANFDAGSMAGKKKCRRALQEMFRLPQDDQVPVFAVISRLTPQKGLDVLAQQLSKMLIFEKCQFVVIGSGDKGLEDWYNYLAKRFPEKIAVYIGYADDRMTHLTEAGADFFVMPSRYEPCGLNQMYSMRYGTLPIVRRTGGLADSVTNFEYSNGKQATGFSFNDLHADSLMQTLRWAASVRAEYPAEFRQVMRNAMQTDFSWKKTASLYERMYDDAHK